MRRIILKPRHDRRVRSGHPWIFSNEIERIEGDGENGGAVEIVAADGTFLGRGYHNGHSLIAARILSRRRVELDDDFYRRRLQEAIALRRDLYRDCDGVRLVYGESDNLSGLVVDQYGSTLSLQFLSLGMERQKERIIRLLRELLAPAAIVLRNDVSVRELEGLPLGVEVVCGTLPDPLIVSEHGLRQKVDILGGQKTGHFLDQKENHQALRGRVEKRSVLDLFCYSGSWGLHAARFGAASVLGIDISAGAIALCRENAALNGLEDRCTFRQADVFEELRSLQRTSERFDTIILDPPAFVKSRKKLDEAIKGYLTVNRRAIELLAPGGTLFTCSCSHHMERELFIETVRRAAAQANRSLRLVEVRGQAYDHPVLLFCPESDYLKCLILQAVD